MASIRVAKPDFSTVYDQRMPEGFDTAWTLIFSNPATSDFMILSFFTLPVYLSYAEAIADGEACGQEGFHQTVTSGCPHMVTELEGDRGATCSMSSKRGDSFPKLGVPFLGVPIKRIIVFWGLYWVPLFWETTRSVFCSLDLLVLSGE